MPQHLACGCVEAYKWVRMSKKGGLRPLFIQLWMRSGATFFANTSSASPYVTVTVPCFSSPTLSRLVQHTDELPGLSSNLSRELFPRMKTLPSFFLSAVSDDYPGGNWALQQFASGEPKGRPAKNIAPLPSTSTRPPPLPFCAIPSCASWVWLPRPYPISEEFPCWNSEVLSSLGKTVTSLSFSINFVFLSLLCVLPSFRLSSPHHPYISLSFILIHPSTVHLSLFLSHSPPCSPSCLATLSHSLV